MQLEISGHMNSDHALKSLNATAWQGIEAMNDFIHEVHNIAIAQGGFAPLARKTGLSQETIYKTLHPNENPHLKTFLPILNTLGFDLAFRQKNSKFTHKRLAEIYPELEKNGIKKFSNNLTN